jgi:SAM-dependent methyltransferase
MREIVKPDPAVFTALAAGYDADFTYTALGRILRRRVWRRLRQNFEPGQHVLEVACGTGEDAVWLAGQGIQVTATDGSPEMIRVLRKKALRQDRGSCIIAEVLSLQSIAAGETPFDLGSFDGAFSNFGGLNTIDDWPALAGGLAALVRPGGRLVLVPMGPLCPWEIGWHLAHGQPRRAFRRFKGSTRARVGERTIPIWYPSAGRLRRDFRPWFKTMTVESLGLWLPPSYLRRLLCRWPEFWVGLSGLEAATGRLTAGAGDHYILILERL